VSQTEGFAEDSFVLRSLENPGVEKGDKTQHAIIKDIAGVVFVGKLFFPRSEARPAEKYARWIEHHQRRHSYVLSGDGMFPRSSS